MSGAHDSDLEDLRIISAHVPPESDANDAIVVLTALFAAVCGIVFWVGLILDWPLVVYGTALAVGLLCMAVAIRRYFVDRYPDVEAIEPRIPEADERTDEEEPLSDIAPVGRRKFLTRVLVGAGGVFAVSVAAPPIASLGPAPGDRLRSTRWAEGLRLVTTEGEAIRPSDVAPGGVVSVWPEGAVGEERSAALLIRLSDDPGGETNLDWVVDGNVVAYSKICTHAGCPVALYREGDNALFCPCHQSTFDVRNGAVVTFGPAYRALPQLPLGLSDAGFLIATGDFPEQVGPAFG